MPILDKEPSVAINGTGAIATIALILGFKLSPEAAAALAFAVQAVSSLLVRQNVFSKETVSKIKGR